MKSNEDLYKAIRGIEQMAEISVHLTVLFAGVGATAPAAGKAVFAAKEAVANGGIQAARALDLILTVCGVLVEDDDVQTSVRASKALISFVQGKFEIARSGKELVGKGADALNATGFLLHAMGESVGAVNAARNLAKSNSLGPDATKGLDKATSVLQKVLSTLGKSLESQTG